MKKQLKKVNLINKKSFLILLLVVLLLLVPFICNLFDSGLYFLNVINYCLVYSIATMGLNIMTGYSGQINLGGAAYFAVGAYSVVILNNAGVNIFISVIIGLSIVGLFGLLTAIPAAKLKFHFLALATMAVGEVINNLLTVSPWGITNDTHGMFVNSLKLFGIKFNNDFKMYFLLLLAVMLTLVFSWSFIKSRTGRACMAVRDNVDSAEGCGIDVRKYKIIATVTSCLIIGFAGFLFAYLNRYISPDTFSAGKSTMFMSMMMLGGSSTLFGPILGTILITIIMESLRNLPQVGMFFQLSYGIILLAVMMFMPQGLSGVINNMMAKRKMKRVNEDVIKD